MLLGGYCEKACYGVGCFAPCQRGGSKSIEPSWGWGVKVYSNPTWEEVVMLS